MEILKNKKLIVFYITLMLMSSCYNKSNFHEGFRNSEIYKESLNSYEDSLTIIKSDSMLFRSLGELDFYQGDSTKYHFILIFETKNEKIWTVYGIREYSLNRIFSYKKIYMYSGGEFKLLTNRNVDISIKELRKFQYELYKIRSNIINKQSKYDSPFVIVYIYNYNKKFEMLSSLNYFDPDKLQSIIKMSTSSSIFNK